MLRNKFEIIRPHIFALLILSGVTFALYWQALGHNFLIYWDDNGYVTRNLTIQRVTWENIKTAFTSLYMGNYAPVQILSYMFDYSIWGMRPAGFIFTNILIHIANGILFYYLLTRLSWQRLTACAAALIFLIHPVQVESVVWVSERKNVLSMLFFLLSLIWYIIVPGKIRETAGLFVCVFNDCFYPCSSYQIGRCNSSPRSHSIGFLHSTETQSKKPERPADRYGPVYRRCFRFCSSYHLQSINDYGRGSNFLPQREPFGYSVYNAPGFYSILNADLLACRPERCICSSDQIGN